MDDLLLHPCLLGVFVLRAAQVQFVICNGRVDGVLQNLGQVGSHLSVRTAENEFEGVLVVGQTLEQAESIARHEVEQLLQTLGVVHDEVVVMGACQNLVDQLLQTLHDQHVGLLLL